LEESQRLFAGLVNFKLWIAQGFGVGRIPAAPGTFGSLVGAIWFALLLATGNFWLFVAGMIAGAALSVWMCGEGERILNQKDPGSVVLDEIAAIPLCFAGWVGKVFWKTGAMPQVEDILGAPHWLAALGVFVAFRFFDVLKPWPVRQSQSLPGGWGVAVDDLLAAFYVNAVVLLVYQARIILSR
jgi:phosphatidylglycerophosphatase A